MAIQDFKYIYGPVASWRLGSSLGVDPISDKNKICSFDCVYCQLGRTLEFTQERKNYVPVEDIINEIKLLPAVDIDYITFSGRGEPTLAKNLGEMIQAVRKIRHEKIAVITNSSLLEDAELRKDLSLSDLIMVKLDAFSDESLQEINQPIKGITFQNILNGIKQLKKEYKGDLVIQIMFIQANQDHAKELAQLSREIGPVEVQINTPLRPCGVSPLNKEEINAIKPYFFGLKYVTVYDSKKKKVEPISAEETLRRRGKSYS